MAKLLGSDELIYVSFPLINKGEDADGNLVVEGVVTDGTIDSDRQRVDPQWSKTALTDWMQSGPNVRVMHSPHLYPAGRGLQVQLGENSHSLKALIVEDTAKKLVRNKVLTAFSVGIAEPVIETDYTGKAAKGIVMGGILAEVSLVDRPANGNCRFTLAKAATLDIPWTYGDLDAMLAQAEAREAAELTKSHTPTHAADVPTEQAPEPSTPEQPQPTPVEPELEVPVEAPNPLSPAAPLAPEPPVPANEPEPVPEPDELRKGYDQARTAWQAQEPHPAGGVGNGTDFLVKQAAISAWKAWDAQGDDLGFTHDDPERGYRTWLAKRDFDPGVGGGVDRDTLSGSDFLEPDRRKFPIVTPADVPDAAALAGKSKLGRKEFKRRLKAKARAKGPEFEAALPDTYRDEDGGGVAKSFTTTEPLATGLAPYNLAGQEPPSPNGGGGKRKGGVRCPGCRKFTKAGPACRRCGAELDGVTKRRKRARRVGDEPLLSIFDGLDDDEGGKEDVATPDLTKAADPDPPYEFFHGWIPRGPGDDKQQRGRGKRRPKSRDLPADGSASAPKPASRSHDWGAGKPLDDDQVLAYAKDGRLDPEDAEDALRGRLHLAQTDLKQIKQERKKLKGLDPQRRRAAEDQLRVAAEQAQGRVDRLRSSLAEIRPAAKRSRRKPLTATEQLQARINELGVDWGEVDAMMAASRSDAAARRRLTSAGVPDWAHEHIIASHRGQGRFGVEPPGGVGRMGRRRSGETGVTHKGAGVELTKAAEVPCPYCEESFDPDDAPKRCGGCGRKLRPLVKSAVALLIKARDYTPDRYTHGWVPTAAGLAAGLGRGKNKPSESRARAGGGGKGGAGRKATPSKAVPTGPAGAKAPRAAKPVPSQAELDQAASRLKGKETREQAQAMLSTYSKAELFTLAEHMGIAGGLRRSDTRRETLDRIVQTAVGARLDSRAIRGDATLPYGDGLGSAVGSADAPKRDFGVGSTSGVDAALASAYAESRTPSPAAPKKRNPVLVGTERAKLAKDMVRSYVTGQSIQQIADELGRSYGFVHRILTESGLQLRQRGGAKRRKRAAATPTLTKGRKGKKNRVGTPLPPHREPDGPQVEAFEADAGLAEPGEAPEPQGHRPPGSSGDEVYKAIRMHDALCPAYHPTSITHTYPTLTGIIGAVDPAVLDPAIDRAIAKGSAKALTRLAILRDNATALHHLPPAQLSDVRIALHKAFAELNITTATPSPTGTTRATMPAGYRRPAPNFGHTPTAEDAHHPMVTDNLPTPSLATGSVRDWYPQVSQQATANTILALHDHIAGSLPHICPMAPTPTLVPTDMRAGAVPTPVVEPPGLVGKTATPTPAPSGLTTAQARRLVKTAIADTTTKLTKAHRAQLAKLQADIDTLGAQPDPNQAPLRGIVVRPASDTPTATPVDRSSLVEKAATAARDEEIRFAALLAQSPDPTRAQFAQTRLAELTGQPAT